MSPQVPMEPARGVVALGFHSPWPAQNGIARRLRALLDSLAEISDLRIILSIGPNDRFQPPSESSEIAILRRGSGGRARHLPAIIAALASGQPLMSGFYRTRHLRAAVAAATADPDTVLLVQGVGGLAIAERVLPLDRVIVDLADYEPARIRMIAERSPGWRRLQWLADVRRIRHYLASRLPRCMAVLVVSEADAAAYRDDARIDRLVLVPNGVDDSAEPRSDPGGANFLFVGDLRYPPNADGLRWFCEDVLSRPSSLESLTVVGRGEAPPHPKVDHKGFVDDLGPVWERAVASLVPLRAGGGTRIKVLESMAHGVPIISTRLGAAGIGAEPGLHYLEAADGPSFRRAMDTLVADADLRARLAQNSLELVERFRWRSCTRPLQEAVLSRD